MKERHRVVRAPYRKKKGETEGLQFFTSEKKVKESPYYEDLANEDLEEAEEELIPDPLKRKGFDKD